jgi:thiamine-monophosphate kinase
MLVEGVHFDRSWSTSDDIGWKALSVNVSDLAAMGGRPVAAVAAVGGADRATLEGLYRGISAAAQHFGCPIVGGDLSGAASLVLSLAVLGSCEGAPVRRSGGRAGERLFVTGPLGAASAGLRQLRDAKAIDDDDEFLAPLVRAHRRPMARLIEGRIARELGASAMIDLSDGLELDVDRLCVSSGVGVEIDYVPVAPGASEDDARYGGEDYELLFSLAEAVDVSAAFSASGCREPIEIGRLVVETDRRQIAGRTFRPRGYLHDLGR